MVRLVSTLYLALCGSSLGFATDLDSLLHQVASYDFGKDPSAMRQLESEVLHSAGTPNAVSMEKRLIAALAAAETLAARDALCRDLSFIGTAASVQPLSALLLKADTAEMARYALERIPGDAANAALRKALPQAPAGAKPGIVNSLGRRKDAAAVAAVRPLLESSDPQLAAASATALAHIGTPDARRALLAAKPNAAVSDAMLQLAQRENGAAAAEIYRRLQSSDAEAVRTASIRGLARVDGRRSVPILVAAINTGSSRVRSAAIRELAALDRAALIERTAVAPVQVLAALADSGQADVLPLLERHLASDAQPVRIAALNGIAKLGTAKQVPAIAARAAETTGEEQAAARNALATIRGGDVDTAILQAIPSATSRTKVELIHAAGDRGIRSAPETLLKTASDSDKAVRAESIRALRETAGPPHVPALVALLVKTEDESDRKEYERAVAYSIRRSKEASVADVIGAFRANSDPDARASLLSVMSAVGNADALPTVREALKSRDGDVQRAAINAMAGWPSPEPIADLLELARTSANASQQVLALRGYVKLVQIPSNRQPARTAKLLEDGMGAAKRPDEKKLVLAAAQRVICQESLDLVKRSLDDPAVAAEARLAQTSLERALSYRRN